MEKEKGDKGVELENALECPHKTRAIYVKHSIHSPYSHGMRERQKKGETGKWGKFVGEIGFSNLEDTFIYEAWNLIFPRHFKLWGGEVST